MHILTTLGKGSFNYAARIKSSLVSVASRQPSLEHLSQMNQRLTKTEITNVFSLDKIEMFS